MAKEHFERHKQPWRADEAGQLRTLAAKGKGLRDIAKALNRSEESVKDFAKQQKIEIVKKR
ncbi:phage terminase small subunit-related protein [Porphyrobacter sp. GA68]|uniref:phage terminase small subunit-related protein n=1 Tax=Porphyrobacter sp. GA68 TaxID=2883480 RepID=UPI001D18D825|nr:phage terminase small subunit-related protein [Porphyrobacter sp. GA68]